MFMALRRLLALLLFLALLPAAALAAETDSPTDAERFAGKDWETVMAEFMEANHVDPNSVGIAYYNTVTGEEHFINGDRYRFVASIYKLPLNMYFAEKIYLGEMSMDDTINGWPYRTIQTLSLENSNNQLSEMLQTTFAGWEEYKKETAHLIAEDYSEIDPQKTAFAWSSQFTPRQILHALKLLYESPERFPDVLEHMKKAQQDNYFALYERRYQIAHKYGFYIDAEMDIATINDCGVVFTDDPILLVVITDHTMSALNFLARYCELMCDWTQYNRALRLEQEAAAAEEARLAREAEEAERARLEQEAAAAEAARRAQEAEEAERARLVETAREEALAEAEQTRLAAEEAEKESRRQTMLYGIAASVAAVLLLSAAIIFGKSKRAQWGLSTVVMIALAAALLLMLGGCAAGPADTAPETAPPEAAATPAPTSAPVPTPAPAPTPTPEPTPIPVIKHTLRGTESAEEILALAAEHPSLRYVDGTLSGEYEAMAELIRLLPDCEVTYTVDLGGVPVKSTDTSVVLSGARIGADGLIERLAWLPALETVDLCPLGMSDNDCISVLEAFPEKKVVWTVHFGRWALRTDATCFSTLNVPDAHLLRYRDEDFAPLFKYCRDLVALDLGHNNLKDLTPLAGLTKLQVLILGDNPYIEDISPLGALTELRYLEYFMSNFPTDFSCFYNMPHMVDLCIGFCPGLTDISFVYNMPDLEMGWFPYDGVSEEQEAEIRAAMPETRFCFRPRYMSSTSEGWRATEDNLAVRLAFSNWREVVDFRSIDDIEYREGAWLMPVEPSYS